MKWHDKPKHKNIIRQYYAGFTKQESCSTETDKTGLNGEKKKKKWTNDDEAPFPL